MEYCRGWTDQARPSPTISSDACGRGSRRAGFYHLRAGQMVSGRKPAALGVRSLLAQGWRADLKNSDLIATIENPRRAKIEDAERFAEGTAGEAWRRFRDSSCRRSKTQAIGCRRKPACRPNVDPSDSRLSDPEERSRMARVFDQGLNVPKGFVLPIQRWNADAGRWRSERWKLRRGNLFLTPGDSPLGLRLPIASLPHIPAEEYPYIVEQDSAGATGGTAGV